MREISVTDVGSICIGQTENAEAATGCTVFIAPEGMRAGLDVRGGGPASRESQLLNPLMAARQIHAIVFAGDAATAADAEFALPSDWDGGNLRVKIAWSPAEAGTAGDLVRFLVAAAFLAEGSAVANPSALAPTPVTDALLSDDVDTTHITDAFTVTPPSGATGGVPVHLHLARDVSFQPSSGTMSSVAVGVLSVLVQYKRTNDRGMW